MSPSQVSRGLARVDRGFQTFCGVCSPRHQRPGPWFRQRDVGHLWTQSDLTESLPLRSGTVFPFQALGASPLTLCPWGLSRSPGPAHLGGPLKKDREGQAGVAAGVARYVGAVCRAWATEGAPCLPDPLGGHLCSALEAAGVPHSRPPSACLPLPLLRSSKASCGHHSAELCCPVSALCPQLCPVPHWCQPLLWGLHSGPPKRSLFSPGIYSYPPASLGLGPPLPGSRTPSPWVQDPLMNRGCCGVRGPSAAGLAGGSPCAEREPGPRLWAVNSQLLRRGNQGPQLPLSSFRLGLWPWLEEVIGIAVKWRQDVG